MGDGTCKGCREGHYDIGNGVLTNFPCTTAGCPCWFCGPVKTPAQAAAREVAKRSDAGAPSATADWSGAPDGFGGLS